ncbi:MAG TPA: ankyrin repeat domain-containing protein [Mucilaginibacter sp.]|jgi:ankyrin repeat protein
MNINSVHQIKDGCGFFSATPLWYAYTRGRNKTLYTYLLANEVDPEHCMYAIAWYDDADSAELFKAHGASIDDGANGDTPFLAAFMWRKFQVSEWFLKNGVHVNAVDLKGNTALFYAIKRKYPVEYIEMLLRYGADCNQENKEGISPKKLAELNRQAKILKLLKDSDTIPGSLSHIKPINY